ncbi:hypothetical protein L1887_49519 [Cichorium endivia]|nr:hypothetical protein L1887_49519 [Cichorium endivia]
MTIAPRDDQLSAWSAREEEAATHMSVLYFSDHQCILCSVWRQNGCFEAASLEDVDMKSCFTGSQLRCRAARQVDDLMARQRRSVPRPSHPSPCGLGSMEAARGIASTRERTAFSQSGKGCTWSRPAEFQKLTAPNGRDRRAQDTAQDAWQMRPHGRQCGRKRRPSSCTLQIRPRSCSQRRL